MYIILIAWLYVTLLMAASEANWVAGVLTFTFYGLLPGSLFWWLLGGRSQGKHNARRAAERARQAAQRNTEVSSESLADPVSHQRD